MLFHITEKLVLVICIITNNHVLPAVNNNIMMIITMFTVTASIDQALHQFLTLLLIWTLSPNLTFYLIARGFHRTFATGAACQQRSRAYSSGHLVMPNLGTFKCSNVETNLSRACLVSGLWVSNIPRYFCFALLNDWGLQLSVTEALPYLLTLIVVNSYTEVW